MKSYNVRYILITVLSFLIFYGCKDQTLTVNGDQNEIASLKDSFTPYLFEKIISYEFKVDWKQAEKGYSNSLDLEYYDFPIVWTSAFNPSTAKELRESPFLTYYRLIGTIESGEAKFFILKIHIEETQLSANPSWEDTKKYSGQSYLFSQDGHILLFEQFKKGHRKATKIVAKNEPDPSSTGPDISRLKFNPDCHIVTVDHYIDWYQENMDGSIIYLDSHYTGTSFAEYCGSDNEWPDEPGGGGSGGSWGPTDCQYSGYDCYYDVTDRLRREIILDPTFKNNECLSSVFSGLRGVPNVDKILKQFDGAFAVGHLKLAGSTNLPSEVNARTKQPENYVIGIDFNLNNLNRPSLDVARTMIHEIIHAEMYRKLLAVAQQPSIPWSVSFVHGLKDSYPGLYDYYMRWHYNKPDGFTSGSPQHQMMAEHYRSVIESALRAFDPSHDDETYKALAWIGLMGSGEIDQTTGLPPNPTIVWENLSQQNRLIIIAEINGFRNLNPPCQN